MLRYFIHVITRGFLGLVVAIVMAATFAHPVPIAAQSQLPACMTYRETGKTLCGGFLAYWEQRGGIKGIGKPLSNLLTESTSASDGVNTYTIQYFEYAALKSFTPTPTIDQIVQEPSTPAEFKRRYPDGEPEPYIENPPRVADARNVIMARDDSSLELGLIMTYTTSVRAEEVLDFYRDVMPKNGWVCAYSCTEPRTPGFYDVGFDWDSPIKYNFHALYILVTESNIAERVVSLSIYYGGGPPEIPPPLQAITPNPTEQTLMPIGMPSAGEATTPWPLVGMVSLIAVLVSIIGFVLHSLKTGQ